jgi:hypothetical protein
MGWGVVGSWILSSEGEGVGAGRGEEGVGAGRGRNSSGSSWRLAVGKLLSAGSKPGTSGSKKPTLLPASALADGLSRAADGDSLSASCFLFAADFSVTSSFLSFSLKWSNFLPDLMGSL